MFQLLDNIKIASCKPQQIWCGWRQHIHQFRYDIQLWDEFY